MYVLTFVMAMLMVLAAMTYAKITQLTDSSVIRAAFNDYTRTRERDASNQEALRQYNSNTIKQGAKNPAGKSSASRRLDISLLVDPKGRINKQLKYKQQVEFFKNLLTALYRDQQFFREAEKTRPSFLEELIDRLSSAVSDKSEKDKISEARHLANIDLGDSQLNELFYNVLKGKPLEGKHKKSDDESDLPPPPPPADEEADDEEEEEAKKKEAEEYRSPEGYLSILDFITINTEAKSGEGKVRLFLASPYVLEAMLSDKNLVADIVQERETIYKELLQKKTTKELGKQQMEQLLKDLPTQEKELFDFTVSKTNPKSRLL